MSTQSDIEITVHNKKQLKVLIEKMVECKIVQFLYSGTSTIEKESGVKNLPEWLDNYEDAKNSCMVSLAYYDQGFILCLIIEEESKKKEKEIRDRVMRFLNGIKIPEKSDKSATLSEEKRGDRVNLYARDLTPEQAEKAKRLLVDLEILNMDERPFYEQDPVY